MAEGVTLGTWRIEPGTRFNLASGDEIVVVSHERNTPIYVKREELSDLLGALMLYLDVQEIEPEMCMGAVGNYSGSAPEMCALEEGHQGRCRP